MTSQPDKESKTEDATPRRIEEALKKGNTPFSREAGAFGSVIGIIISAHVIVYSFSDRVVASMIMFIERPHEFSLMTGDDVVTLLTVVGLAAAAALVPAFAVLIAMGLVSSLLQNPPRISSERIKPQWSRVSISKGAQRVFGSHGRIEVLKAVLKFSLLGTVVTIFIANFKYGIINAVLVSPRDIPQLLVDKTTQLFATVAGFLTALVVADLIWSRMKWRHDLRMSKDEVKDEHKQAEGDPAMRARQRSLARDRARQRMLAAVPRATVIIANPTHYAIALRYVKGEQAAPIVVAKGMDHIALKIRAIAEGLDIPVIEDKALARSLYGVVVLDRPIPPEFYKAVAEIIMFLMSRKGVPMPKTCPQA